jgi:AsmA protein
VVESLEGQGGKSLRELRGLTIPLTVKGELTQPKFGLKLDELLTGKAKAMAEQKVKQAEEEARKKLDKEKQKLEQKAKDKLQEALKDKVKLW